MNEIESIERDIARDPSNWDMIKYYIDVVLPRHKLKPDPAKIEAIINVDPSNWDLIQYYLELLKEYGWEPELDWQNSKDWPTLVSILKNSRNNWRARAQAAKILGAMKSKLAIPALVSAMQSDTWEVSRQAAEALGEIGSELAIPALVQIVRAEGSLTVRSHAIKSLGLIDSENEHLFLLQRNTLVSAMANSSNLLSREAQDSLSKIAGPEYTRLVLKINHILQEPRRRFRE